MIHSLAALHDPAWQRLGVALVHFIWQGILIVAAYQLWLALFNVRRASQRYVGGLVALALMAVCPIVTWSVVDVPYDLLARNVGGFSQTTSSTIAGESQFGAMGLSWIVAAWLFGVTMLIGRVLIGALGVSWVMHRGAEVPDVWRLKMIDLSQSLGLARVPRCVISPSVREALAAGFFRPFVIVPAAWLSELPPHVLEAVLAHELAHIRRWDLWVNLAQRVVESLLFYHPAVWWLSRSIRIEREMCCDDLAVSVTKQHVTYASALETVARRRLRPQLSPLAVGMGGPRMALLARVRNVLGIGPATQGAVWWPIVVLALGITLAIWLTSSRGPVAAEAADRDGSAAAGEQPSNELAAARPDDRRPPGHWGPPPGDGPPPRDGHRRGPPPDGPPRPDRRPPPDWADDRPPTPHEEELMRVVRDLRAEVMELRRDVREIRDRRPPPLPPGLRALIDSLPRDENGRPTWGPPGAPSKDDRKEEPNPVGPPPERQAE